MTIRKCLHNACQRSAQHCYRYRHTRGICTLVRIVIGGAIRHSLDYRIITIIQANILTNPDMSNLYARHASIEHSLRKLACAPPLLDAIRLDTIREGISLICKRRRSSNSAGGGRHGWFSSHRDRSSRGCHPSGSIPPLPDYV